MLGQLLHLFALEANFPAKVLDYDDVGVEALDVLLVVSSALVWVPAANFFRHFVEHFSFPSLLAVADELLVPEQELDVFLVFVGGPDSVVLT